MSDVAEKSVHPVVQFRKDIKAALPTFGLSSEKEQERMSSVLMIAVEKDPDLLRADRQSLISAVRQCANHGVVPDGNEATLQIYNTKVKIDGKDVWIKKVQYQPMVRGIINRVLRSGRVKAFWAEVVYQGEAFSINASDGERRPAHEIRDHFSRGTDKDIIGAYSVAKMKDGTVDCEPMPLSEIQKVRAVAKTQKVWDGWFSEKCKVAVMRRHSKRLPLSAEDMDMILNRQEHDLEEIRDVTPTDGPNLAQRLKAAQDASAAPRASQEPEGVSQEVPEDEPVKQIEDAIDVEHPAYQAGHAAYSVDDPEDQMKWEGEEADLWKAGWEDAKQEAG